MEELAFAEDEVLTRQPRTAQEGGSSQILCNDALARQKRRTLLARSIQGICNDRRTS
jgi:hypothetical protein